MCAREDTDGVRARGPRGHVPLSRHLSHLQHPLLDLLLTHSQCVWSQPLLEG